MTDADDNIDTEEQGALSHSSLTRESSPVSAALGASTPPVCPTYYFSDGERGQAAALLAQHCYRIECEGLAEADHVRQFFGWDSDQEAIAETAAEEWLAAFEVMMEHRVSSSAGPDNTSSAEACGGEDNDGQDQNHAVSSNTASALGDTAKTAQHLSDHRRSPAHPAPAVNPTGFVHDAYSYDGQAE